MLKSPIYARLYADPGGQNLNPNGVDQALAYIADPGVQVLLRAKTNHKMCCYYLRFEIP
jgi:hypothetical protein